MVSTSVEQQNPSYDVLVVGCGFMGSALARTFASKGLRVAAWNRTAERAEALSSLGIDAVRDLASAVAGTDLVLTCMANHGNVQSVLEPIDTWADHLVVNLTTATPEQSDDFAHWSVGRDIEALSGSIFNYPAEVGTPAGYFVYSGPNDAWERGRPTLEMLGPSMHVAHSPGASSELLLGMVAYFVPAISSFIEAATYLERRGMPREVLLSTADYLTESLKSGFSEALDAIELGKQGTDQATLSNFAESVDAALVAFGADQMHPRLLEATRSTLAAARAQGLGDQGIFAQANVL